MKHWILAALLVASVICAGAGIVLSGNPFGPASFGWTAYSPLSSTSYRPVDPTWLRWAPTIGLALLTIGAGSAGAMLSALVLLTRGATRTTHN